MLRRCYVCNSKFASNSDIEHFAVGNRVAYDAARGRLWAVCGNCNRWSLAPIESRWEALEELERVVRDRSRLLAKTANIALFKAPSLQIIRVGHTEAREECWWRYGRQLRRRRLRYATAAGVGATAIAAAVSGVGIAVLSLCDLIVAGAILRRRDPFELIASIADSGAQAAVEIDRRLRFGKVVWRGARACVACGASLAEVSYRQRGTLVIGSDLGLRIECTHCRGGYYAFDRVESQHVLRRALAYHNHAGGTPQQIDYAARAILRRDELLREGRYIGMAEGVGYQLLALEMIANSEIEHELLQLETAELEARWRLEEGIAGIADGELTPLRQLPGSV